MKKTHRNDMFTLVLCILSAYCVIWAFTDRGPFQPSIYHSYVLQANRWLAGHLDLGQNYSYLELAVYHGKYFVSFPPVPSVLLLPFCALFGQYPPDTLISVSIGIMGGIYALKLAWLAGREGNSALFWALFATVGSNFLHLGYSAEVWYFAQTCSFTFTMAALYYATAGGLRTGWLPCFLLALAFGCRPLQIVYLPLILLLVWRKLRESGQTYVKAAQRYWWWILPPLCVGGGLMLLNYARFSNVFQFGHDFLPEFTNEKAYGQFSLFYLWENWKSLWTLPELENGIVHFPIFNGCAFWIFSPIFLVFAVYFIKHLKTALHKPEVSITVLLITLHLAALCCHATMGGWQFGNRYTVDTIPAAYFALMVLLRHDPSDFRPLSCPLLFWGVGLNLTGTIALLNCWI